MKQKITAVLLLLALLIALSAGCSGSSDSAEEEENVQTAEAESEEAAVEETQTAEEETAAAEEETDLQDQSEETAAAKTAVSVVFPGEETACLAFSNETSLPLTQDTQTLVWLRTALNLTDDLEDAGIQTYAELESVRYVQSITGVELTFVELAAGSAAEEMALYLASGDSADLITDLQYTGGASAALEDGVILDLTDLLAEAAPDYLYLIRSSADRMSDFLTDGRVLSFRTVYDRSENTEGLVIRSDWLEDLGLNSPATYDELEEVLLAFRSAYDCSAALYLDADCVTAGLAAGYDIAPYACGSDTLPYFVQDGEVQCTLTADGFRDFLQMLHQWYEEGLIPADFAQTAPDSGTLESLVDTEQTGVWGTSISRIDSWDVLISPAANPVTAEGDTDHITSVSVAAGSVDTYVSATCENPELAMAFLDWFYSEDGILFAGYGQEEEDYTLDDSGTPQFTEAVTRNSYGLDVSEYMQLRGGYGIFSTVQLRSRTSWETSTLQNEATEIWSDGLDGSMALPEGVVLDAQQQETVDALSADILAYASEIIPQFITGAVSLKEWDSYVSMLEELQIADCIAAQQEAYDRFLNQKALLQTEESGL